MIDFIGQKSINWCRVENLLNISRKHNRWSNFGPVSHLLEQKIAEILQTNLTVVCCSSGSTGIWALANMLNVKCPVSSFGFPCTIQGPLSESKIVDCDQNGIISEPGLITNVFSCLKEIGPEYPIIDSAVGFDNIKHRKNTMISLHHTKPWGFGEGGCVLIDKADEAAFRSLISFGTKKGMNGKMSEISAAFILQWLETPWPSNIYREQFERIKNIAIKLGYRLLCQPNSIPAHVPLIYPDPIEINSTIIKTQKYYRPLVNTPNATYIYDRIVCFPCHDGIASLKDEQIKEVLCV